MSNFWKKVKKPIVTMAPMSGVTDEAFRQMFLKYGKPSVFWTEFVSTDGLFSKGREYCLRTLKFNKGERPIVAQIFGANPVMFEKAAAELVKLGFMVIRQHKIFGDIHIVRKMMPLDDSAVIKTDFDDTFEDEEVIT